MSVRTERRDMVVADLQEACAVVGLAHPFRYDEPVAAIDLAADLDAIEVPYPYGESVDRTPAREAARVHDLLVTGGSDAHDEQLGLAGLERETFDPLRERLAASDSAGFN